MAWELARGLHVFWLVVIGVAALAAVTVWLQVRSGMSRWRVRAGGGHMPGPGQSTIPQGEWERTFPGAGSRTDDE